ncbi:MAG: hypothetical protein PVH61_00585 [Candidatus Aminicenantes bacterium]|jgi:hypothetical protein
MNKKHFAVIFICTILFAFLGGLVSNGIFSGDAAMAQEKAPKKAVQDTGIQEYLLKESLFIGIVKNRKFHLLAPRSSSLLETEIRLTGMQMQEARPPESDELNLEQYEGKAVMVHGHNGGGWIYRAAIVDNGGPLVTALVMKAFSK